MQCGLGFELGINIGDDPANGAAGQAESGIDGDRHGQAVPGGENELIEPGPVAGGGA